MSELEWLSNTYDPEGPDAYHLGPSPIGDQTRKEAYESWMRWLEDKVIGEPKGTNKFTSEQLKKMRMVGVYKRK